jgi:hypothetical protein
MLTEAQAKALLSKEEERKAKQAAYRKDYNKREDVKAKHAAYMAEYNQREEVKEARKAYHKAYQATRRALLEEAKSIINHNS